MKRESETEKEYQQTLSNLAKKSRVKVQDVKNTISNMDSILTKCFLQDQGGKQHGKFKRPRIL